MGPWSPCSACTSKHLQPAKDPWPTGRSTSPIPPPPTDSRTLPSSPLPSTASLPSTGSALIMYSHLATTHGKVHSPFRALGPPQCVPSLPTTTRQPVAPQCVPLPLTTTRCRATPLHCPRSPYRPATYKGKDKLPHPNSGPNAGLYRRQQRM